MRVDHSSRATPRPRDRQGVDLIGLPAPATRPPGVRHQARRDANDPLAALDQKPLERARHMPAILERPDPLVAQASGPVDDLREAAHPNARGLVCEQLPRSPRRRRRGCASSCACPHRARSSARSPFRLVLLLKADGRRTRLAWALAGSYQVTPDIRTDDERQSKRWSDPTGRQPQSESARRRLGTLSRSPDVTSTANRNSKPQSSIGVARLAGCFALAWRS
jgi:hypothetical protein